MAAEQNKLKDHRETVQAFVDYCRYEAFPELRQKISHDFEAVLSKEEIIEKQIERYEMLLKQLKREL